MTHRAIHVSFIRLAAAHLLVTNRFPQHLNRHVSDPNIRSTAAQPAPHYPLSQRCAISSNGGSRNTVIASSIASHLPFRLRVQRRFRPIKDPARPTHPLVLAWTPGE